MIPQYTMFEDDRNSLDRIELTIKIQSLSDSDLEIVWDCLENYDPTIEINNVSADEWANMIYMERSYRMMNNYSKKGE